MELRDERQEGAAPKRGLRRALIVDDDAPTRTLLDAVLERKGFRSVTAGGGEEAIAQLRRSRFDLVLLDLVMPRIDGLEVYRFLRSERPAMLGRTIVFTGAGGGMLDEFLAESEATCEVIRKPLDLERMLSAIERATGTAVSGANVEGRPSDRAAGAERRRSRQG